MRSWKTRTWKNPFKSDSGQSMIIFILLLTVLLGFTALAVDVGMAMQQKSNLQNAADAAVLAGAQSLPDDSVKAESDARAYAAANCEPDDVVTVTIPTDKRSMHITITRNISTFFAKAISVNAMDIRADATASIGVAASVPWIVPFVIPKPAVFDYTHVYVMRMYGAGPYPSNYNYPNDYKAKYPTWPKTKPYPYHFDYMNVKIKAGSNPSVEFQSYLGYLKNGYKETFTVDQNMLYYAPSSGGTESVNTFATRVSSDSNSDYTKAKIGDPRVMLIPVVQNLLSRTTAENTKVTIIGFVGFFLEKVYKNNYGTSFWFEGRFLEDLNIGTGEVTYDPNADFGLRVIKLTR